MNCAPTYDFPQRLSELMGKRQAGLLTADATGMKKCISGDFHDSTK
jgi:hypothetical protein